MVYNYEHEGTLGLQKQRCTVSSHDSPSCFEPLLLSRSKFSPFQLSMAFLASLAGTFRGHWYERGGMIIKTKLQREQSCVCTTLHMLVLEGKQQFSLKAATGLSEGLFMVSMATGRLFFLLVRLPATLPLFITLGCSPREEENHFLGVLFSSYQV